MSFYVNTVQNPNNKNETGVLFNISVQVQPRIQNNLLSIFVKLSLYGDFRIPINSILVDIFTDIGEFKDIQLNLNTNISSGNDKAFTGEIITNINSESSIIQKEYKHHKLTILPKFRVDTEAFNKASLTLEKANVQDFINEIVQIRESELINNRYYLTNHYQIDDITESSFNFDEINRPHFKVNNLRLEVVANEYNLLTNFMEFTEFLHSTLFVSEYQIKFDFENHILYNFVIKNNENEINDFLWSGFSMFDFANKKIILTDEANGYPGFWIPYKCKGTIAISFKIGFTKYSQNLKFEVKNDLFGQNSLLPMKVESYE